MTTWTDEYYTMIEDCEKRESRMTEWEQSFIASVSEQLTTRGSLSPKQIELIDRIWERVTRHG